MLMSERCNNNAITIDFIYDQIRKPREHIFSLFFADRGPSERECKDVFLGLLNFSQKFITGGSGDFEHVFR